MNTQFMLNYLAELSANNNREWYHAHKQENKDAAAQILLIDFSFPSNKTLAPFRNSPALTISSFETVKFSRVVEKETVTLDKAKSVQNKINSTAINPNTIEREMISFFFKT